MPKYLYTYWGEGLNEMFKLKKYTSIQGYSLDGFRDLSPDLPHIWSILSNNYLISNLNLISKLNLASDQLRMTIMMGLMLKIMKIMIMMMMMMMMM